VGHPQIAAFARLANGGAKAVRAIAGQNTLFTRTIHDMAYDAVHDEILVPGFFNFSVLTFRGDANGDVAPVRKVMGPNTQIVNNDSLAIDPVHGEIFVPVDDKILVFPRETDGDAKPIRILEGVQPTRVTIDPIHNLMIVSGNGGLRIFDRTASGNAKPLRFINGPGAKDVWLMTMYPEKGMVFGVVRPGNTGGAEGDTSGRFSPEDYVGVWSVYDDGNVPARFTIGGPNLLLKDGRGIAIDPKAKNVYVSDKTLNAVLTFNVPEAFQ
jgi:hypothetical protein